MRRSLIIERSHMRTWKYCLALFNSCFDYNVHTRSRNLDFLQLTRDQAGVGKIDFSERKDVEEERPNKVIATVFEMIVL